MKQIKIYHHKDCGKCRTIARVHRFFDWLDRLEISTETAPSGPLQPGEIEVEDLRSGETCKGVEAVRRIARQIPAYILFRPLLRVPFIARRVDRSVRGCVDGSCAIRPGELPPEKVIRD